MRVTVFALVCAVSLLFASCSKSTSAPPVNDVDSPPGQDLSASEDVPVESTYTYHRDIRPMLDKHCLGCHAEGGIGPFSLDTYEDVRSLETVLLSAIVEKRMPPWQPTQDCIPLQDERIMSESEIEIVTKWVEEGAVQGEETDYVPEEATSDDLGEPDLLTDGGEAYVADTSRPDDWRCFPLRQKFEKETFVEVIDVFPDQKEIVHHVLLYLIPASDVAQMEQKDANEEGAGYTCFGGPGVGSGDTLGGWVPGSVRGKRSDSPTAFRIPAGARVVMQVHYNVLGLASEETPKPDKTQVAFWTLEEGQTPDFLLEIVPFPHFDIEIPPGESDWQESKDFILPLDTTVVGVTPHMHSIGKNIKVEHIRDGQESCVIDIPEWDFNWQQFYRFQPDSIIEAKSGDTVRLNCGYNNSAENQVVINGVQQDPTTVYWGDSTLDEMCLTYLIFMKPYGEVAEQCQGAPECIKSCNDGDHMCFTSCLLGTGNDCAQCVVPAVFTCGATHCPTQGGALLSCSNECDGDPQNCLLVDCASEYQSYYACLEPHLEAGECDDALADCGVSFKDQESSENSEE